MSSVVEQMHHELSMELHHAKSHLQSLQEKNREQTSRISQYENMYLEFIDLKLQVSDSTEQSEKYENVIARLKADCARLIAENKSLLNQNKQFSDLLELEKSIFTPDTSALSAPTEAKQPKRDFGVIGDGVIKQKLQNESIQELVKKPPPGFTPSPTTSPGNFYKKVKTASEAPPTTPIQRSIVQEVKNNKQSVKVEASDQQTHSLMVMNLFNQLSLYDITKYFQKFGAIEGTTVPVITNKLADGKKYMFLKFAQTRSVDRAVDFGHHQINGVEVIVKKGKDL